jgi:hypothetical protein
LDATPGPSWAQSALHTLVKLAFARLLQYNGHQHSSTKLTRLLKYCLHHYCPSPCKTIIYEHNIMSYQARPCRTDKAGSSERSREHVPTAPGTKELLKIYQKDSFETHLHGCAKGGSGSRSRQHVLNGAPTMLHGRDNSPLGRPDKTDHTTRGNTRHAHCTAKSWALGMATFT